MFNKNSFSISGPKPAGLKIRRDNEGVPHIQANDMNGAMWGSGYAHAVDRGTQLMMMRVLGKGRLCELLSDTDESLKIDRLSLKTNMFVKILKITSVFDEISAVLTRRYCPYSSVVMAQTVSILNVFFKSLLNS